MHPCVVVDRSVRRDPLFAM